MSTTFAGVCVFVSVVAVVVSQQGATATHTSPSLSFSLSGLLIDSYLWQSHGRSILFSSFSSIFGIVCECDLLPHSVCVCGVSGWTISKKTLTFSLSLSFLSLAHTCLPAGATTEADN